MKDQNELPKDLGGYQQVVLGIIEPGDIIRPIEWPFPNNAIIADDGDAWIGQDTSNNRHVVVYRKTPCPTQGGHATTIESFDETYRRVTGKDPEFAWDYVKDNPTEALPKAKDAIQDDGKAKTNDEGKPPMAWLPWAGIEEVAMVQAYGHSKYKDFNNYRKGMEVSRNLSCAMRHIGQYMEGIDLDEESGRSHLGHAACRILFVLQNLADGTAIDDRYTKP